MAEQDDLDKQLLELRYITQKTGALHPLQMKNLQMWGYLMLLHVKPSQTQVFFHYDKRTVTYSVPVAPKMKTKTEKKNLAAAWGRLNAWVQQLLGFEYRVLIEAKEKVIFTGKRDAAMPKPAKPAKYVEPSDE